MKKSESQEGGEGAPARRNDRTQVHTSFRTSQSTIDRLDSAAQMIQQKQVGKVTRADVIRTILNDGLSRLEFNLRGMSMAKPDEPKGTRGP